MKKLCATLVAAMVMAVVGLQGAATAAPTAWPTGCSNERYDNGWMAHCKHVNGGHFKASVTCVPWNGGPLVTRDAGWSSGNPSYVFCPPQTSVKSGGIWTRSY
jgi:hypothetical protein